MSRSDQIHPVLAQAVQLCATNQLERCRALLQVVKTTGSWPEGLAEDIEALIVLSDLPKETWLLLDPNAEEDKDPVPGSYQATLAVEAAINKARARGRRGPFIEGMLNDMENRLARSRGVISSARAWVIFSLLMVGSLLICAGLDERQPASLAVAGGVLLALMVVYVSLARLPRYQLYVRFVKGEAFGLSGMFGTIFDARLVGDFVIHCIIGAIVAPFVAVYDIMIPRSQKASPPE